MRISYLSVSDQLGGSEIALLEMIEGVRRLRPEWQLQVILPGRGPLLDRAERSGADCVVLPMPRPLARLGETASEAAGWSAFNRVAFGARLIPVALSLPSYLRQIRRNLRANSPDVVHSNGLKAHVLGARIGGASKVVWHIHEYVGSRKVTRSLLARHKSRAAAILANSASVAADVTAAVAPPVPVRVVHNAVDLESFAPHGPSANLDGHAGWPVPQTPIVRVGLIGTFARWKGHDVFLRALEMLPADLPIRAYIVGAPVYDTAGSQYTIDDLKEMVRARGLAHRVGFTGFLPAAPAMRALDIVVHASTRPEPFGLVIAEAMACGRAVIVSAGGGAAEIVEPEVDSLSHRPGDAGELARHIARLVEDPALRAKLGGAARAAACRRFDPDRMARELVAVYEGIAPNGTAVV